MKFNITIACACLVAFLTATTAQATVVTGGTTVVQPTIDLGSVGLSASPLGSATLGQDGQGDTIFQFGISGGDLNGIAGTIEHDGVGVALSSGGTTLELRDFVINTVSQEIYASVSRTSRARTTHSTSFIGIAPVFDFDVTQLGSVNELFDLSNPVLVLNISATAAAVLTDVFNAPDLSGVQFGLAATAPELAASQVPLPGAAVLFATGIIALIKRRKLSRA